MTRVVLDTNVLVAGLKSRIGKSFQLIDLILQNRIQPAVTTPLVLEYDDVLNRPQMLPSVFSKKEIGQFLDWIVFKSSHHRVHYLWRPFLPDPKDDLVLEAALASESRFIITFNLKDFREAKSLGVTVLTPSEFINLALP